MAANEVHIGDTGTRFELTVKDDTTVVNISTATVINMLFVAPDGGLLTKAGTFTVAGADGKYYYDSLVTDFDEKGVWSWQGYLEMPTWNGYTDISTFTVYANLAA